MSTRAEVNSYLYDDSGKYIGVSADYVIAHAARQAQRGKAPSVAFQGELNPIKALEAAHGIIEKRQARRSDPTLRIMASEFAMSGGRYQSPIEAGHVWGRD